MSRSRYYTRPRLRVCVFYPRCLRKDSWSKSWLWGNWIVKAPCLSIYQSTLVFVSKNIASGWNPFRRDGSRGLTHNGVSSFLDPVCPFFRPPGWAAALHPAFLPWSSCSRAPIMNRNQSLKMMRPLNCEYWILCPSDTESD